MLKKILIDIRPEDVSEEHPVDIDCLQVKQLNSRYHSVLLSSEVQLNDLQPLLTRKAWRGLQQAVRAQRVADNWFCGCCSKDVWQ